MTGWAIRVPYHDRGESLVDVAAAATELPDEERRVVQRLALAATAAGASTAGDLLDRLGSLDRRRRRGVLDDAREAVGLERSEEIDRREAWERMQRSIPPGRDRLGRAFQTCCHPGCRAFPLDRVTGAFRPVAANRWACEAHRDEGDFDPPESGRIDLRTMRPIPPPSELERMNREREELRRETEERNRRRRAEAEATRRAAERYRERHRDDAYAFPKIAGIPQSRFGS